MRLSQLCSCRYAPSVVAGCGRVSEPQRSLVQQSGADRPGGGCLDGDRRHDQSVAASPCPRPGPAGPSTWWSGWRPILRSSRTAPPRATPWRPGTAAVAAAPAPAPAFDRGVTPADAFHLMLRAAGAGACPREPGRRIAPGAARVPPAPPVVGDQRTFKVCANTHCTNFVNVTATAKFVGTKGAIYLDDVVPAGGYTQGDLDALGALFDGPSPNMYEIDTTAFGRETDLDDNGVVIILLTDALNALSPQLQPERQRHPGVFLRARPGDRSQFEQRRDLLRPGAGSRATPPAPSPRASRRRHRADVHPRIPAHDQLRPARGAAGRELARRPG